jgi:hypothetical protein
LESDVSVHDHDEKIFQILNNPLLPQAQISSAIIFFLSMGFQQNHCIQSLSTLEHPSQEESSSSSTLHLCSLNRSSAIFLFWSPVQEDGPWSGQIQTHAHCFHELFCEAYTQTHRSPVNWVRSLGSCLELGKDASAAASSERANFGLP